MIKVLVVDDSVFMRTLISDILNENEHITVIATARNGKEALKKIDEHLPDVITLDFEMPEMNGLEMLKEMANTRRPVPTIMVSSTTEEGAENTLLSLEFGAVDFVTKPSGTVSLDIHKVKKELVHKVITASKAKMNPVNIRQARHRNHIDFIKEKKTNHPNKIVCIGASTGGPRSLERILMTLPKTLDAPVLLVQHMPPKFTTSLAERLNRVCKMAVKEAEHGEVIQNGTVYVAPGDYHLKVKQMNTSLTVDLDQSEERNGHRPSVDMLFESVSDLNHYFKLPVILTGMGSDGARGLSKIKSDDTAIAIAESEESAVIFGMPKAAWETGQVDHVLHVNDIGEMISHYIQQNKKI